MTSLLCVQEPGGFVEHHNHTVTEDVLKDSANNAIFAKYFPADRVRPMFLNKRPFSTPNPQTVTDNLDKHRLMGHSMKLQTWLNKKSVKSIQEKSDIEAKPVKEMYGAVLDREETFVKDMLDYCDNHEYLNSRKREILHKDWSDRVYEPVRSAVIHQMDGENYPAYKTRKDQLYREYIEHLNKKDHVFRDDYDPSEYYAMGLHADRPYVVEHLMESVEPQRFSKKPIPVHTSGLQANTGRLRDPTLLQQSNRNKEDQVALRCTSGTVYNDKSLDIVRLPTLPLAPQGRHGTENSTWTAMKLTDIESDIRKASRKRMVGTNLRSDINFGNWSVRTYGKDTVDKELAIQKRRQCKQPPFTSPHHGTGGAKKRLPAARESHKSRTIPMTNTKYLDYQYDTPFATDEPLKPMRSRTNLTKSQTINENKTCWSTERADILEQTDIVI